MGPFVDPSSSACVLLVVSSFLGWLSAGRAAYGSPGRGLSSLGVKGGFVLLLGACVSTVLSGSSAITFLVHVLVSPLQVPGLFLQLRGDGRFVSVLLLNFGGSGQSMWLANGFVPSSWSGRRCSTLPRRYFCKFFAKRYNGSSSSLIRRKNKVLQGVGA